MTRRFGILATFSVFVGLSIAAAPGPQVPPPPPPPPDESPTSTTSSPPPSTLPDEGNIPDADNNESTEPDYKFNPLQAKKELDVGIFYFKKGDYRGAVGRFERATKWNPGWAEAYFKLGEAHARLKHKDDARKAFEKVIQLEPNSKESKEAKKLLARL